MQTRGRAADRGKLPVSEKSLSTYRSLLQLNLDDCLLYKGLGSGMIWKFSGAGVRQVVYVACPLTQRRRRMPHNHSFAR